MQSFPQRSKSIKNMHNNHDRLSCSDHDLVTLSFPVVKVIMCQGFMTLLPIHFHLFWTNKKLGMYVFYKIYLKSNIF